MITIRGVQFTDDSSYIFATSRIRGLEKRMLTREDFARLADMSIDDALKSLGDYGYIVRPGVTARQYEEIIGDELARQYAMIHKLLGDKAAPDRFTFDDVSGFGLMSILFLKYDFYNFKLMTKLFLLGDTYITPSLQPELSSQGLIPVQAVKSVYNEQAWQRFGSRFNSAMNEILLKYNMKKDASVVDNAFDRLLFALINDILRQQKSEFLKRYFQLKWDFTNVLNMFRFRMLGRDIELYRDSFLPGGTIDQMALLEGYNKKPEEFISALSYKEWYGLLRDGVEQFAKTQSLSGLERLMDNYLIDWLKAAKIPTYGVEPLMGYILGKEYETMNIRQLMVGKLNNLKSDAITANLRISYV